MFFLDTVPWGVIQFWRLHSLASFEKKSSHEYNPVLEEQKLI